MADTLVAWTCLLGDVGFLLHRYHRTLRAPGLAEAFGEPVSVPLMMTALYLAMVYGGRKWMRTREPLDVALRRPMLPTICTKLW